MKTLVTIATLSRIEAACFLKEKLEERAIDCYFLHLGEIREKRNSIRIQVDADDVQKAVQVLIEIRDQYGPEIDEIKIARLISKILVPTDFSVGSEIACHYAIQLAHKMHAEIKLLHIFRNPVSDIKMHSSETYQNYLVDIVREEERKAKNAMVDFTARIKRYIAAHGIENVFVHSALATGTVLGTIKDISKIYKPDLIVMGTQGRNEETTSVFARVSRELVKDLDIPVFAVPGTRPVKDFDKMEILYATDFNESDHDSLNRLLLIMDAFKKHIVCVHIDTANNPANEDRMDELNNYISKEYGQGEIECRLIDYSDVSQGLQDFADTINANLLSFTIQKRGIFDMLFMPNLFKKILQDATLPILIFPS